MKLKVILFFAVLGGAQPLVIASPAAVAPKAPPKPGVESLTLAAKIFRQADAVTREMWWIVAADRRPLQRSPFGKLTRASLLDTGLKLPKNANFKCDSYSLKKSGTGARPLTVSVDENCITRYPARIAEWTLQTSDRIEVEFYPEHLTELLGLGAATLNRKITCRLNFKGVILSEMNCANWAQDRSASEIVQLTQFHYSSLTPALLEVKGTVMEDLNPKKKIETKVLLEGPIVVTETDLPDPTKKPTPVPPPAPKPPRPPPRKYEEPAVGESAADPQTLPVPEQPPGLQAPPTRPIPPGRRDEGEPFPPSGEPTSPSEAIPVTPPAAGGTVTSPGTRLPEPEYRPAQEAPPETEKNSYER